MSKCPQSSSVSLCPQWWLLMGCPTLGPCMCSTEHRIQDCPQQRQLQMMTSRCAVFMSCCLDISPLRIWCLFLRSARLQWQWKLCFRSSAPVDFFFKVNLVPDLRRTDSDIKFNQSTDISISSITTQLAAGQWMMLITNTSPLWWVTLDRHWKVLLLKHPRHEP